MTPIGKGVFSGIGAFLVLALACHALHLDAHLFALIPLIGGALVGLYVARTSK